MQGQQLLVWAETEQLKVTPPYNRVASSGKRGVDMVDGAGVFVRAPRMLRLSGKGARQTPGTQARGISQAQVSP